MNKNFRKIMLLVLTFSISFSSFINAQAATVYKDVQSSHWAYDSISAMADKGYIVAGDSTGNYYPNQVLDKFTAAQILAKAAGFKYVSYTEEEKEYFDQAYNNHKQTLAGYKEKFPIQWNTLADREVAFLLEKAILLKTDLDTFVKSTGTSEQKYGLTREEACVFLIRLIGKDNEVKKSYEKDFIDDGSIGEEYSQYVYYLKSAGVIKGDTTGKFNPKAAVTKAAMAMMLDKTLEASFEQEKAISSSVNIKAKIVNVYPDFAAIQVDGTHSIGNTFIVIDSSSISVDGFLSSFSDLKSGMYVDAYINAASREVLTMKANNKSENLAEDIRDLRTIYGTVMSVNSNLDPKSLEIEITYLTPRGEVIKDKSTYYLTSNAKVTKGVANIDFSSIKAGEIIEVKAVNFDIYSISLEEKDLNVFGEIASKTINSISGENVITILLESGIYKEFKIDANTKISRNDSKVKASGLKIGDEVDIVSEYNLAIDIEATGESSKVEGKVEKLVITSTESVITIVNSDNAKTESYSFSFALLDTAKVYIGSEVELRLDSKEISSIKVLKSSENNTISGTISSVKSSYITVVDSKTNQEYRVYYDSATVVIDGYNGKTLSTRYLEEDYKVYVSFEITKDSTYRAITIILQD